jgi:hypothetical protein
MAQFGHDPAPIRHKRIAPAASPAKMHALADVDKRYARQAGLIGSITGENWRLAPSRIIADGNKVSIWTGSSTQWR